MKLKTILILMGLVGLMALPGLTVAQDSGTPDSVIMVITPPNAADAVPKMKAELYFKNDFNIVSASVGFNWVNENAVMTSAVVSPAAIAAFNLSQFVYRNNNIDSTNLYNQFLFGAARIFGNGLAPSVTRQLIATYNWDVPGWTVNDSIVIDTNAFSSGAIMKFVPLVGLSFKPSWGQKLIIFDPNRPEPGATLVVGPGSLTFAATQGGANPAAQILNVTEAAAIATAYTSAETATWLSLTTPNGTTPGTITVNANLAGLAPGTYTDTVTVTAITADNSPIKVPVTFNVAAAPKVLVVAPTVLNFSATEGGANPLSQWFDVTEAGGGAIAYSSSEPSLWITLTDPNGTTPDSVGVNINITGRADGSYTDTVTVSSGAANNSPRKVAINLTITPAPIDLVVEPDTLFFTGVVGEANPLNQSFNVDTDGDPVSFTATTSATWLSLTGVSGTTPDEAQVSVNIAGLLAGVLVDSITVSSGATVNSPQKVIVKLTVSAADTKSLVVAPSTLDFNAVQGASNPVSQWFDVTELGGEAIAYTSVDGAAWLSLTDADGTTPDSVAVNVDITGLTAGVYADTVEVASVDADNSPRSVVVILTVTEVFVPMTMVVEPTVLNFSAYIGQSNPPNQSFRVTELDGGALPFKLLETSTWISLDKAFSTTPDSVNVFVDFDALSAGTYRDSIKVYSDAGEPVTNGVQWVYVNLTLLDCPSLTIVNDSGSFSDTIFVTLYTTEGVAASFSATPTLESSLSPDELDWNSEIGAGFDVTPTSGTTPTELTVSYEATFADAGTFTSYTTFYTEYGNTAGEDLCYSEVTYCVNTIVTGAVSSDTVRVSNVPAVPGMTVSVPVDFSNSCPTTMMYAKLSWNSAWLSLESVDYSDSRVEYVTIKQANINNGTLTVELTVDTDGQASIAPGSGNWLNLNFSIAYDATAGFYPITLAAGGDSSLWFARNCGNNETETPVFIAGGVVVDTSVNYVCGVVVDDEGNEIEGATVLLYSDFPNGSPIQTTTSSSSGGFAFTDFTAVPFDLYAYKEGYYSGELLDLNFGAKGVEIILTPVATFTQTSQWVDYYCDGNTYFDAPLPVGTVVEAYTGSLLVGQFWVTEAGKYGFMPVYRASEGFPYNDDGATTGDVITFKVNGDEALTNGDVTYPADAFPPVEVCLEAGATITKICALSEGWNLVSWSVNTETDGIESILGAYWDKIDVVLGFEQGGLTYDPELPQFSTLWYVDHLSGYWIKVKAGQAFSLEIEGVPAAVNTPIPVTTGWNLVSYLPSVVLAPVDALASISDKLLFAYGWSNGILIYQPGSPIFNTLDEMAPCNGYWIKVNAAEDLIYPGGDNASPALRYNTVAQVATASEGVTPTTAWVNVYSQKLQLNNSAVKAGSTITALSKTGDLLGGFILKTDGQFGFMPVYADADGQKTVGLVPGQQFHLAIDGVETEQTFVWSGNGDRIEVSNLSTAGGSSLPESYSVAQNYPNPFNPSTTISYSLANAGLAKVEVFNVLGELIAIPFEGSASAGNNTVVWDGKGSAGQTVASGVYFYRLTAGSFSQTMKMMLLK